MYMQRAYAATNQLHLLVQILLSEFSSLLSGKDVYYERGCTADTGLDTVHVFGLDSITES